MDTNERLGRQPRHVVADNYLEGVSKFTSCYGDSQGYVSWPNRKYLKMKQTAFLLLNMDVGEQFCFVDSGTT